MKKTWTAPTIRDFNISSRKRVKIDSDISACEISEPKTIGELAVNPRKIAEVRSWVASSRLEPSPILLICGPPGSGKTVSIKLVADAEGLSVVEWINPLSKTVATSFLEDNALDKSAFFDSSEGKKFEDFAIRSGRYPSLFQPHKRTLILVKDIPNAFIWKPELFHSFLCKYKTCGKSPIVFVVTDDENMDLHGTLFPSDIKSRLGIALIKFNPISDTFLKKNLKNLSAKFKLSQGDFSSECLERIAKRAAGDVRSATNDIIMEMRLRDAAKNQNFKKCKNEFLNREDSSVRLNVGLYVRDHGYDFYKKMGRVLYPKMNADVHSETGDQIHKMVSMAENWNKYYQSFLHENYLQTFSKLEDASAAANNFSFCDILMRHNEVEKCCNIIAVGGLMTANTLPKKKGFLPFKKSYNLDSQRDAKCSFNETSILRFGVEQRKFSLDIAPFKNILLKEIDPLNGTLSSAASPTHLGPSQFSEESDNSQDNTYLERMITSDDEEIVIVEEE